MKSVYFDASFIVSLFIGDTTSERATGFLRSASPVIHVSDFAAAEFVSALGLRMRRGANSADEVSHALARFDSWRVASTVAVETTHVDVALAERHLRGFDMALRAPDALNLAIAERSGAALATFDRRMADAAERLGLELANL